MAKADFNNNLGFDAHALAASAQAAVAAAVQDEAHWYLLLWQQHPRVH